MRKIHLERAVAAALAVVLVLGIAVFSFAEEQEPHWAQESIERWNALGVSNADPDGALNLGEAARMFTALLGLDTGGDTEAAAVFACADAGLLDAEMLTTTDPEAPVSREAYFVMLSRALRISGDAEAEEDAGFSDFDSVSPWAREAVRTLAARGYVDGVARGVLDPGGEMTRGGALSLLDRTVAYWASADSAFIEADGGRVLVSARDVLVTGRAEEVVIADGARDSAVTLENLTVRGRVVVGAGAAVLLTGETAADELRVEAGAEGTRVYIGQNAEVGDLLLDAEDAYVAGDDREEPDAGVDEEAEETMAAEPAISETPAEAGSANGGESEGPEPDAEAQHAEESAPEETPGAEQQEDGDAGTEPEQAEEEKPGEESPEVDAPVSSAESVGPGKIIDYATGETPFTGYELKSAPAEAGENCDVLVEITMTGLKPHLSRGAGIGWWTGFSVNAPEGADGVTAEYSHDGVNYGAPVSPDVTEGLYAHYFDAARWNEYYVRLTWSGASLAEEERAPTTYKLDFRGVELDMESLTTEESLFGRFGTAGLRDLTSGVGHKDKLFDEYSVTVEGKRDENGGYLEIAVRATGLESFRTVAGSGCWAGFSIVAPYGAESYKYSAYLSAEAARSHFAQKTAVPWESFTENVDGAGAYGIVQRTNAAREDQREYWAVLQWYADAEGTVPLTAPEVFHIVLDAVLAE